MDINYLSKHLDSNSRGHCVREAGKGPEETPQEKETPQSSQLPFSKKQPCPITVDLESPNMDGQAAGSADAFRQGSKAP